MLEAGCIRNAYVIESMGNDTGETATEICIDSDILKIMNRQVDEMKQLLDCSRLGYELIEQMLSDFMNKPVIKKQLTEASGVGVAIAAGLNVGYWESMNQIQKLLSIEKEKLFHPNMSEKDREQNI